MSGFENLKKGISIFRKNSIKYIVFATFFVTLHAFYFTFLILFLF